MCKNTLLRFLILLLLFPASRTFGAQDYEFSFSTYMGGSGHDAARAVAIDEQGNIFVAGGTKSANFPTTPGVYDRTYNTGGRSVGSRGPMDVFVTKLDSAGRMVWSTFLGGPNYDRAYTVRVDAEGFVYVAGRAGEGFPTTPESVQPEFAGDIRPNRAYGKQDGFITKLSPDGSRIIWSTYFGTPGPAIIRDIDLDAERNIYVTMIGLSYPSPHVTRGAFQERPPGGEDSFIAKVSSDGSRVVWGTYLGGSGRDFAPSIQVDAAGHAFVAGSNFSTDFPTTVGSFQRKLGGKEDAFVVKFSADGSRLLYSTFIGGSQEDGAAGKHGLAIDNAGRAYAIGFTSSVDFPTTPQAFQRQYKGGTKGNWRQTGDRFLAVLSVDGSRLEAATLLGGEARDGGEGIDVDTNGRIYLGGFTYSRDFPITKNAFQSRYQGAAKPHGPVWGGGDGTAVVLTPDLQSILFSTYMSGSGEDMFRACVVSAQGDLILVGSTTSEDWPTKNAIQSYATGLVDVIVVKISPLQ